MFIYAIICNLKIHYGPEWWFVSAYKMNLPYPPYFNCKSPLICHQFVTLESVNYWVILPLLLMILYQMDVSLVQYLCPVFFRNWPRKGSQDSNHQYIRWFLYSFEGECCVFSFSIVFSSCCFDFRGLFSFFIFYAYSFGEAYLLEKRALFYRLCSDSWICLSRESNWQFFLRFSTQYVFKHHNCIRDLRVIDVYSIFP